MNNIVYAAVVSGISNPAVHLKSCWRCSYCDGQEPGCVGLVPILHSRYYHSVWSYSASLYPPSGPETFAPQAWSAGSLNAFRPISPLASAESLGWLVSDQADVASSEADPA